MRVDRQRKAEIGIERPLVKFVEQHSRDPIEGWVVEDHPGEDALGHHLNARPAADPGAQPHAQADGLSDSLPQCLRHPLGSSASGETTGLEDNELSSVDPRLVEEGQRNARCLACPWRGDQNRVRPRAQTSRQLAQNIIDRQRSLKRAHVA